MIDDVFLCLFKEGGDIVLDAWIDQSAAIAAIFLLFVLDLSECGVIYCTNEMICLMNLKIILVNLI